MGRFSPLQLAEKLSKNSPASRLDSCSEEVFAVALPVPRLMMPSAEVTAANMPSAEVTAANIPSAEVMTAAEIGEAE